ncbi:MAG: endopeptidase La [bacterium]
MSEKLIPVLPMRDIIIYPQMVAPIFVTRSQSTVAVENALMTDDHEVILLAQKTPSTETPDINKDFYDIGILGKVVQILKFPDGSIKALIEGLNRIKISNIQRKDSLIQSQYEILEDIDIERGDTKALLRLSMEKFQQYIQKSTKINAENFISISEIQESGKLADIMATYLSVDINEKQQLLQTLDTYERLELVSKVLSREIEMLGIEEAIQEKVRYKLGKSQKEYLLREKLRVIKEELGSGEGIDEIDEYRELIKKTPVPKKIKEQLNKELNRLEKMPVYTAETSVIRTYIDTVIGLPWCKKTKDILDIKRAKEILDEDHYGLEDAKERILEFLAVKKLSKQPQATIICFTGPPGVGKTSLARSVARSLNRSFAQVSLGGINDESEIRGHRRTYIGAMPGRIIRAIQDAGTRNPIILLDEIEKMVPSHMGDPNAAMLEVLDPAQNSHFRDHYIDMAFDLSDIFFIATANTAEYIYKPLKDRLETIALTGYTEEEKVNIAEKFLMLRQFKANGMDPEKLKITDSAIREIINKYTREAGVRELERSISKICRKIAVEIISNPDKEFCVDAENIHKYLGTPKFVREEAVKEPQIGLVHGLAWTEFGGEMLEIEASIMPGKGKLNLTGRLGEIMQESAKTAFSFARSNYENLNLPHDIQEKYDVHIHAADGATPKDGPSAGIALTLALISALTKRPIKADIAMTGEITLRGRVLPIGGLKEKCIAALRNNIHTVIIPKANEKDIPDLPDYIREKIKFKTVNNFMEVLDIALLEAPEQYNHQQNGVNKDIEKIIIPDEQR